jgi:hypothetical protein
MLMDMPTCAGEDSGSATKANPANTNERNLAIMS